MADLFHSTVIVDSLIFVNMTPNGLLQAMEEKHTTVVSKYKLNLFPITELVPKSKDNCYMLVTHLV